MSIKKWGCMIQKGQVHYVGKDVMKQNSFVRNVFGLAE
jgi:hypothetical protein